MQKFSFKKVHLKQSFTKCRPFYGLFPAINVLRISFWIQGFGSPDLDQCHASVNLTVTTRNIEYFPITDFKLKSREINLCLICPIVLKFCTGHGSVTAVPGTKLSNDPARDIWRDTNEKHDIWVFKMSFGWMFYIVTAPEFTGAWAQGITKQGPLFMRRSSHLESLKQIQGHTMSVDKGKSGTK